MEGIIDAGFIIDWADYSKRDILVVIIYEEGSTQKRFRY